MTAQEKYIYNAWLETLRRLNNKPVRFRKDFSEFDPTSLVQVQRLAYFFTKFPLVNMKDFLEAPYFVYNEKYFDLKFYNSQRAITAYTTYNNVFLVDNPDHAQSLLKIRDSFVFISKFCKENNIKIAEYTVHVTEKLPSFMIHLKDSSVVLYALFVFPLFDETLAKYDVEIKRFIFGSTFDKLNFYRTKYYGSRLAKKLCIGAYAKLIFRENTL